MSYPKVAEIVRSVLKTKMREGETTKSEATLLAWKKMELAGGPTAHGIGRAAMMIACQQIIGAEVLRQFKSGLADSERIRLLPSAPEATKEILGKTHRWIAIEEGADARRRYWLKCTREDWKANADLKEYKAHQTLAKANESRDVYRFLENNHLDTLGDVIGE